MQIYKAKVKSSYRQVTKSLPCSVPSTYDNRQYQSQVWILKQAKFITYDAMIKDEAKQLCWKLREEILINNIRLDAPPHPGRSPYCQNRYLVVGRLIFLSAVHNQARGL